MSLYDSHAHLDSFVKNASVEEVIDRAYKVGVERIVCCSTTVAEWEMYGNLCKKFSDILRWQIGLHPTELSDDAFNFLDALPTYFFDNLAPVAVGEIGLDYHYFKGDPSDEIDRVRQQKFFAKQLSIARDLNVKVCVHARDSLEDCIRQIADADIPFENTVFHCFSGTAAQLEELNELGARASFTGIITYKSATQMRDAMRIQGVEKLMLETDCPYLAPVPLRGETNEPANIVYTYKAAAEILDVDEKYLRDAIADNVKSFFNI